MIEEAMSITPIIFVLVILLFGFDSTGQVRTQLALKPKRIKASWRWILYRDSPDKLQPGNDWAKTKTSEMSAVKFLMN